MKFLSKFSYILLFLFLLVVFMSVNVSATGDEDDNSQSIENDVALAARQKLGVGSDEQVATARAVYEALVLSGMTKEAAAGMLGNAWEESSWLTGAEEEGGTGEGVGLWQFSTDNRKRLESRPCEHEKQNVNGFNVCCDPGCQTAFLLSEMGGDDDWVTVYLNAYNKNGGTPQLKNLYSTYDAFTQALDPGDAAICMGLCYERPGAASHTNDQFKTEWQQRYDAAIASFELMENTKIAPSTSVASSVGEQLVSAGYWSEDDLAIYNKLVEKSINLEKATRERLNQSQLEGLAMWERENQHSIEEGGLISWLRRIVMLVGILFTIWMALIYCAYWFDRINNFFYIDALGFLTAGHLHMSENEQESTFRVKDLGKDTHKTVRHRDILFICLVGVAFGVCIITGFIYDVLNSLIRTIFRILGGL